MASGGIADLKKGEPIHMDGGGLSGGMIPDYVGPFGKESSPDMMSDSSLIEAAKSSDPSVSQAARSEIEARNSQSNIGAFGSRLSRTGRAMARDAIAIAKYGLNPNSEGYGPDSSEAINYLSKKRDPLVVNGDVAAPPASPAAATPLDTSNITPSEPVAEAQPMYRPDFNYESTAAPAAAAPEAQPASAYDQAIQRLLNPPAAAKVARSSPVSGAAEKGATNTQPQRDYASEYETKVNDLMSKMGADPEKRREQNINNALMQAGLGIAGSKGPNFMNALVSGAQQGLGTYQTGNEDIRKQQLAGLAGQVTAAGELAGLRQKQDISAQDIASRQAISNRETAAREAIAERDLEARSTDAAARRAETLALTLAHSKDILAQINAPSPEYRSDVAANGANAPNVYNARLLAPILTSQSALVNTLAKDLARVAATGTADPNYIKQLEGELQAEKDRLRGIQDQFSGLIGVQPASSSTSTSDPKEALLRQQYPGYALTQ